VRLDDHFHWQCPSTQSFFQRSTPHRVCVQVTCRHARFLYITHTSLVCRSCTIVRCTRTWLSVLLVANRVVAGTRTISTIIASFGVVSWTSGGSGYQVCSPCLSSTPHGWICHSSYCFDWFMQLAHMELLPSCEADILIVMQTQTCSAGQQDAALMPPEHKA